MQATRLDQLLAKSTTLFPKEIDLSLDRMKTFLALLGNPEQKIPPVVHVAGTNGKGSTIAFMRAILEEAGYGVHVYTSPHLVQFNERIRIAGKLIEDDVLESLLEEVLRVAEKIPITFFELTTAVAFLAFARWPADIVLLETGMGGRLDATNVIPHPLATVITPISYDHMSFLGTTLRKITQEKAGILKMGAPVITSAQTSEVFEVLKERAQTLKCLLYSVDASSEFRDKIALRGDHQVLNARTALMALEVIQDNFPTTKKHQTQGLQAVCWPGRLQKLEGSSVLNAFPLGSELWLDGAHNQAGGEVLKPILSKWHQSKDKPLVGIMGMLNHKKPEDFLKSIVPFFDYIVTVPIQGQESHAPERLVKTIKKQGGTAESSEGLKHAIDLLQKKIVNSSRILITGSLYLVGEGLTYYDIPRF